MIRLLVVDDSALMRRLLLQVFEAEGDFEVRAARDADEALSALNDFAPQVITLDVQMPGVDGLECLDRIMMLRPTPVVMVSAVTLKGAEETMRAIELGAVDVAAKPSGALALEMDEFGPRLAAIVRAAAGARISRTRRLVERVRARAQTPPPGRQSRLGAGPAKAFEKVSIQPGAPPGLVVVGASTGGPPALDALLMALPPDFPWPIVIAQHMPATFTAALAKRLDTLTPLRVSEVGQATALQGGCVYVGRGDADLILGARPGGPVVMAAPASPEFRWHPSVDRLTDSALGHLPATSIVGVLMTGMGNDGASAMTRLRKAGGRTIAEAEETAVVWGMPGELVKAGGAEFVLPLEAIGPRLAELLAA